MDEKGVFSLKAHAGEFAGREWLVTEASGSNERGAAAPAAPAPAGTCTGTCAEWGRYVIANYQALIDQRYLAQRRGANEKHYAVSMRL